MIGRRLNNSITIHNPRTARARIFKLSPNDVNTKCKSHRLNEINVRTWTCIKGVRGQATVFSKKSDSCISSSRTNSRVCRSCPFLSVRRSSDDRCYSQHHNLSVDDSPIDLSPGEIRTLLGSGFGLNRPTRSARMVSSRVVSPTVLHMYALWSFHAVTHLSPPGQMHLWSSVAASAFWCW